jgi:hypothetical protein
MASLAGICHGPNAWSLEGLRALALQRSLALFDEVDGHPSIDDLVAEATADLLTDLARSDHLLGGPGALERWLATLARTKEVNAKGQSRRRRSGGCFLSRIPIMR